MKHPSPSAWIAGLIAASLLIAAGLVAHRGSRSPSAASAARHEFPAPRTAEPASVPPTVSTAQPGSESPAPATAAVSTSQAPTEPEPSEPASRSEHPAVAGMVVAVDPETGALGMPEHELQELTVEELQAQARHEAEGLVTVRHPDGSESIEHQGRFTDYTVVRMGPGGRPLYTCVSGPHGIQNALRRDQPARPALEEE